MVHPQTDVCVGASACNGVLHRIGAERVKHSRATQVCRGLCARRLTRPASPVPSPLRAFVGVWAESECR